MFQSPNSLRWVIENRLSLPFYRPQDSFLQDYFSKVRAGGEAEAERPPRGPITVLERTGGEGQRKARRSTMIRLAQCNDLVGYRSLKETYAIGEPEFIQTGLPRHQPAPRPRVKRDG